MYMVCTNSSFLIIIFQSGRRYCLQSLPSQPQLEMKLAEVILRTMVSRAKHLRQHDIAAVMEFSREDLLILEKAPALLFGFSMWNGRR